MHFDRFDICAAFALYSQLWGHDAYTNQIQYRLHLLKYRASRSEETLSGCSENAQEIYLGLVKKHQSADAYAHECKLMAINFEEI